ncbi:hypothetical protein Dfulv_21950 [Dactylosporangium fulvum]|uniref:Integral membrane protein n=1 Tax=Dactylosporangium fulvum TaxID=53359 RepID=A0ABY5WDA0_9ACTN|nr:hypothetical protein [Dactylosporangium fulvum]UWP86758.1 hypothetical protein Dfulv_21950 [Dactylosporangium fulvum]
MTRRLAALLLALAALRWPAELREDMLAEWSAEVHTLAGTGRHWPMLRFAASLAATRARVRPFSLATTARRAWAGLRLLFVLPVAALAVGTLGGWFPLLAIAGAVLMAVLGRTAVPRRMPVTVLIPAVTVPGCALYTVFCALGTSNVVKSGQYALGNLVFCAGLTLILAVVARLVHRRRQRQAWLAGIVGAVIAADVAVAVAVSYLGHTGLHPAGAPMWFVAAITGTGFGLPHPNAEEIFTIRDILDPPIFLALAGLALGAVVTARARIPATADG